MRSRWADLGGPTHYLEVVGDAGDAAPPLVCVHGLAGSHANWLAVADLLADHYRVLVPDLPGHGLTRPALRDCTVEGHARLLHRFVTEVAAPAGDPVALLGNSMGGLLCLRQAARTPATVSALALMAPAVPTGRSRLHPLTAAGFAGYAVPGLGELLIGSRRRRSTAEQLVAQSIWMCCADPSRVPADLVEAHQQLWRRRSGHRRLDAAYLTATRSLLGVLTRHRAYAAMTGAVSAPVLMVQGDLDRLVPVAAARRVAAAHPDWRYVELAGVGHVPMLEIPERTADLLRDWLAEVTGHTAPAVPAGPDRASGAP